MKKIYTYIVTVRVPKGHLNKVNACLVKGYATLWNIYIYIFGLQLRIASI